MDSVTRARTEELLRRLTRHATPACKKRQAAKQGLSAPQADGAPLTLIRQLVKGLPRPDQELANALWQTGTHGARQLAVLLADPAAMTPPQLCRWAETLETEDVCDLCATELFSKTKNPLKLAARWVKHPREMTRRAGFGIVCALAAPRAKTAQADLLKAFALLKNGAADPSPFVYKTVNKALKMLGKKNAALQARALDCADEIIYLFETNHTARWVAQNARISLQKTEKNHAR